MSDVWAAMDTRLAEIYALWPFGLQLPVQHQRPVEPKTDVALLFVFGPANMHGQLVPFSGSEFRFPLRSVASQIPGAVLDQGAAAIFGFNPPCHDIVVSGWRIAFPIEEAVAILGRLRHI